MEKLSLRQIRGAKDLVEDAVDAAAVAGQLADPLRTDSLSRPLADAAGPRLKPQQRS